MNVRLQYGLRFGAGIYYNNKLTLNEYTVKVYMMTNSEDPGEYNVALERLKHFVYGEMEGTIFIDSKNIEQCQKLLDAGLNITTLPATPVDQLIGIMLFSKFNAITENRLLIGETEISSSLSDGISYLHSDTENVDLDIKSEWWDSCDLVHCDMDLLDSEKVVTMHKNSVWRDLELQWPNIEDNTIDDDEIGNTVVFADFKTLDDKE